MAFSVSSVVRSIVSATTRKPHAVKLTADQDRFAQRNRSAQGFSRKSEPFLLVNPISARSGKSSEALEHDTLTRIRDALYHDQQV